MKNRKKYFITSLVILGLLFTFVLSYEISYRLTGAKEAPTVEQTKSLQDDTLVVLRSKQQEGYITDKVYTIKEVKELYKLSKKISKDDVKNIFTKEDYSLQEASDSRIVFNRNSTKFIPNKFYLGAKDDYLAIYKSNEKGELILENPDSDVFITKRKVSTLDDVSKNKIQTFQKYYETREEAEENITEFF